PLLPFPCPVVTAPRRRRPPLSSYTPLFRSRLREPDRTPPRASATPRVSSVPIARTVPQCAQRLPMSTRERGVSHRIGHADADAEALSGLGEQRRVGFGQADHHAVVGSGEEYT